METVCESLWAFLGRRGCGALVACSSDFFFLLYHLCHHFLPLCVEGRCQVHESMACCHSFSLLLVGGVTLSHLEVVQLQRGIEAHLWILVKLLFKEVELGDALEELLTDLG